MKVNESFKKLLHLTMDQGENVLDQLDDFSKQKKEFTPAQVKFARRLERILDVKLSIFDDEQTGAKKVSDVVSPLMDNLVLAYYNPHLPRFKEQFVNYSPVSPLKNYDGSIGYSSEEEAAQLNRIGLITLAGKGILKDGQLFYYGNELVIFCSELQTPEGEK